MRWLVAFLLTFRVAQAAPEVEIRAHTQVVISHVRLVDANNVEVVGYLRDKLTGAGIANQDVSVQVGTDTKRITTGPDGGFTQEFQVQAPTQVQVAAEFVGDDRLEKSDRLTITTDPSKARVSLTLNAEEDPSGARVTLTALSEGAEGSDTGFPVALDVSPLGGTSWKKLGPVKTSSTPFILARDKIGGAGLYQLRAQYAGDDAHQPTSAMTNLTITSGTVTTMSVSSFKLAFEDDLVVKGHVTDDDGKALPKVAVTLMSGDRRLAQGTTNDKGDYRFAIEAEVIAAGTTPKAPGARGAATDGEQRGPGQYGIQVQTDPGVPYIKGSRSNPAIVRILAPQPVPVSYTVMAFIATIAAAGGFFLARTRPWQKLRRPQKPADVPSEEGEIEPVHGGLVVAKPGVVATLRRPNDDGFAGVVRDTVRGRPVENAIVVLTLGNQERSTQTSADGTFAVEKLESGEWRAHISATGHIAEKFAVTIPHRGELRGVRVDLVPVRERVFQLYRRAAEPVLPEPRLWGIWSPRQIVDHVRAKRPSPALAELTDFVEEIYFSPRLAEETVLPQTEGRVTRAVNERARPPAQ